MSSKITYPHEPESPPSAARKRDIETDFIQKLVDLKYIYRPALERRFRETGSICFHFTSDRGDARH